MATATVNSPETDVVEPADTASVTPRSRTAPSSTSKLATGRDQDESTVDVASAAEKGIGATFMIGVPLTMFVVCAATVLMCVVGGIPLGEAIGYGTYLAVWIGGGFGVILTGAYYNHVNDGLEG